MLMTPPALGALLYAFFVDHLTTLHTLLRPRTPPHPRTPTSPAVIARCPGCWAGGRRSTSSSSDWGLTPLGAQERHDLLEVLEDRCGERSTIIAGELPIKSW